MKQPRPYQEQAIQAVQNHLLQGISRQLMVLFTGAGKTFTAIKLLERLGFTRVLWLSYQTELVSQSALAFIRDSHPDLYNDIRREGFIEYASREPQPVIGCIKSSTFKVEPRVIMGSVKTIYKRLDRLPPDFFDCIVCDEAHLFGSMSAITTLDHFKPRLLLGLTATPHREDGMMMGDIFDKIVFNYDLSKGIRDGYACELEAVRVKTTVSLDQVRTTAGELNQADLSDEINTLARNQLIVDSYKTYAKDRQTIAYCVNIQHAMDLAEQFRMNGINCKAVSSNEELTPDRSENIRDFTEGRLQVITNVNILVAGFDHPDTGCLIMACPTKSLTKYLQSAGRGARLKSEEYARKFRQNCIIIDIVDSTSRHNLINAWEIDKKLPLEDRMFITTEQRDKLREQIARKTKLQHQRKEDERVKLLKIPELKISTSIRMTEPATDKQLEVIGKWGYDTKEKHYTKKMVAEIFSAQPASAQQVIYLKNHGYDITSVNVITLGMFQEAVKQVEKKKFSTK